MRRGRIMRADVEAPVVRCRPPSLVKAFQPRGGLAPAIVRVGLGLRILARPTEEARGRHLLREHAVAYGVRFSPRVESELLVQTNRRRNGHGGKCLTADEVRSVSVPSPRYFSIAGRRA
jgi:hypothetical protein